MNRESWERTKSRRALSSRRLLQASAGAGLPAGLGRGGMGAALAQEMTYSRDYDGTTLNLLMEDLQETTIAGGRFLLGV